MEGWQVGRQRRAVPGPQRTEPTAACQCPPNPRAVGAAMPSDPHCRGPACHSRQGQMWSGSLAPHTSHSTECPGGLFPCLPFPQLCSIGERGRGVDARVPSQKLDLLQLESQQHVQTHVGNEEQ